MDLAQQIITITSIEEMDKSCNSDNQIKENETKEQKGGFLGMFLGTLGVTFLGNKLAGKEMKTVRQGQGPIRACNGATATSRRGWGTIRAGQDF